MAPAPHLPPGPRPRESLPDAATLAATDVERPGTSGAPARTAAPAPGTIVEVPLVAPAAATTFLYAPSATDTVQRELTEEHARLATFVEHAPAAIAMVDREMRYLAVSRRWLSDYQLGEISIQGRTHYEVFPNIPERWRQIHRRGLAGTILRCDHDVWRPEGWEHDQHLRWEVRPWYTAERQVGGLLMMTEDVTAERQVEQALREARAAAEAANRAKSEFLANMSHEIRTPLTSILGYTELLREALEADSSAERRHELIDTVQRAGQHLLALINDILDLSKIEAGCLQVERVEFTLPALLNDLRTLLAPRAAAKGVQLTVRLSNPVPECVRGDPTRLRQILVNLVGNALKFTEHGHVTLTATVPDGKRRLQLEVEDSGVGMTPEQAARLFRPFAQADASVTRQFGGTGLGLTISRRLAELLGGTVTLERTAPGQGSVFRLALPLEVVPGTGWIEQLGPGVQPSTQAGSNRLATPSLAGRILLVEDGADNRLLIAHLLRRAGAEVQGVEHGQAALEELARATAAGLPYQLIVTDMQMPVMDGYTLATTLRAQGSRLPIVALTANAMAEDRARCLAAGCDAFATKPIDKADLLATCARWLAEPRLDERDPGGGETCGNSRQRARPAAQR